MDALGARSTIRLSAIAEWLIAASFLFATAMLVALIVRELRPEPALDAAGAPAPTLSATPAAIPSGAISVPVLPLADGTELKLGQSMSVIAERLGRAAESGRQEVDRVANGERLTRFYEYRGTSFILVFEPFEAKGEPRLAAIYLR
jgi:hypothetical protein